MVKEKDVKDTRKKVNWKIKFKKKEYLLIGDREGAITTEQNYREGIVSYAHLRLDGRIMRYNSIIGNIKDIEFIEMVNTPEMDSTKILSSMLRLAGSI